MNYRHTCPHSSFAYRSWLSAKPTIVVVDTIDRLLSARLVRIGLGEVRHQQTDDTATHRTRDRREYIRRVMPEANDARRAICVTAICCDSETCVRQTHWTSIHIVITRRLCRRRRSGAASLCTIIATRKCRTQPCHQRQLCRIDRLHQCFSAHGGTVHRPAQTQMNLLSHACFSINPTNTNSTSTTMATESSAPSMIVSLVISLHNYDQIIIAAE